MRILNGIAQSNEEDDSLCITSLESDLSEKAKVTAFATNTCRCRFGKGEKPCSESLSMDEYVESRNNCHELTSTELDLVILGGIQISSNFNEVGISGRPYKHPQQTRMAFLLSQQKNLQEDIFIFALPKQKPIL